MCNHISMPPTDKEYLDSVRGEKQTTNRRYNTASALLWIVFVALVAILLISTRGDAQIVYPNNTTGYPLTNRLVQTYQRPGQTESIMYYEDLWLQTPYGMNGYSELIVNDMAEDINITISPWAITGVNSSCIFTTGTFENLIASNITLEDVTCTKDVPDCSGDEWALYSQITGNPTSDYYLGLGAYCGAGPAIGFSVTDAGVPYTAMEAYLVYQDGVFNFMYGFPSAARVDAAEFSTWSTTRINAAGVGTFTQTNTDNLRLDGNSVTSTNTNGNINLTPNGNGEVLLKAAPVADLAAATKKYVDDSGSVLGNVVTVAKDGTGNFTTIQAAIDSITGNSASNRYTVLVYPGIYAEQVTLNESYVSLIGVNKENCRIERASTGAGGDLHTVLVGNSDASDLTGIEIRNLTIKNTVAAGVGIAQIGLRIYQANSPTYTINCNVYNCDIYGQQDSFFSYPKTTVLLSGCYIDGAFDICSIWDSNLTAENCKFYTDLVGINASVYVDNSSAYYTRIENCYFNAVNSTSYAIKVMNNDSIVYFTNNFMTDIISNAIKYDSGVANTTCYASGNYGVNAIYENTVTAIKTDKITSTDINILNTFNLPAGGNITVNSANAYREIVLTADGAIHSATNGAAANTTFETSTSKQNFVVTPFADAEKKYLEWTCYLPLNYSGGTLTYRVMWTSTDAAEESATWGLQAVAYGSWETLDCAWGTAVEVTSVNYIGGGATNLTDTSAALTIGTGGTLAGGQMCQFRLYRDGNGVSDDLTATANFRKAVIRYPINAYSN